MTTSPSDDTPDGMDPGVTLPTASISANGTHVDVKSSRAVVRDMRATMFSALATLAAGLDRPHSGRVFELLVDVPESVNDNGYDEKMAALLAAASMDDAAMLGVAHDTLQRMSLLCKAAMLTVASNHLPAEPISVPPNQPVA